MAELIEDGNAAFPIPGLLTGNGDFIHPWGGMTLRDYFAAAALHGLLSDSANFRAVKDSSNVTKYFAGSAYEFADAMIRARSA